MVLIQALYETASNLRRFQTASVFPSRGIYCAGNENANPVEPKTLNWKPFPVNLVNKTTSTCLKSFLKHFFKLFDIRSSTGDKPNFLGFNSFFYSCIKLLQDGWWFKSLFQWQKVF